MSDVTIHAEKLTEAYRQAGLNDAQAAAVLLARFTYGAGPGDVERLQHQGLANWLQEQLDAQLPESRLQGRLAQYDVMTLSDRERIQRYPSSSLVAAHARRFFPELLPPRDEPVLDFSVVAAKRDVFAKEQGFRPGEELRVQVFGQKILHATYAENQLAEVLTDFWHNHFFTSAASFDSQPWLLSFERRAVRPQVLGSFRVLLGACAMHPALTGFYLYQELPMQVSPEQTTQAMAITALRRGTMEPAALDALVAAAEHEIEELDAERDFVLQREFWAQQGPNLPLANALLRLMTLGPDSGVNDADVSEAARVLTGWTVMPLGPTDAWFAGGLDQALQLGFAQRDNFLFRADWHDAREKTLLGLHFDAGGGLAESERLLDALAAHEATARHIAHKLAVRFVSDEPHADVLEHMSAAFKSSGGSIAAMLAALTSHPEFWRAGAARTKGKNPLEYAISALRALDADIQDPQPVAQWIGRMGRPLYSYQEPSGYPEDSAYWLHGAALANRLNYAQQLASAELPGVHVAAETYANTTPNQVALLLAGPDFQLR